MDNGSALQHSYFLKNQSPQPGGEKPGPRGRWRVTDFNLRMAVQRIAAGGKWRNNIFAAGTGTQDAAL